MGLVLLSYSGFNNVLYSVYKDKQADCTIYPVKENRSELPINATMSSSSFYRLYTAAQHRRHYCLLRCEIPTVLYAVIANTVPTVCYTHIYSIDHCLLCICIYIYMNVFIYIYIECGNSLCSVTK